MDNDNLNTFPLLTTESLRLRQLLSTDAEEIFLLRSDTSVNQYLERQPTKTLEEAMEFIKKIKDNAYLYWAIGQKTNDKLIGTICLFDVSEELKKCEIGFELLTDQQGKGIMREAAMRIIEYAFQILELKTIEAYTHKDNCGSIKLLQKLKFISKDSNIDANSNLILFQLQSTGYK